MIKKHYQLIKKYAKIMESNFIDTPIEWIVVALVETS